LGNGGDEKYRIFVEKPEGMRLFGRRVPRWEDIKMDPK
jgi:hypothetical protein